MSKFFLRLFKNKQKLFGVVRVLSDAKVGDCLKISCFLPTMDFKVKRRLLVMGLLEGCIVKIAGVSVLGKVFLLEVGGYMFSIRKDVAKQIKCKVANL